MTPRNTDTDGSRSWLERLDDADFSEGDERIDTAVLEPPIDEADIPELCRLLHTDERPEIRRNAAKALGSLARSTQEYGAARILDELTKAVLTDGNGAVRAEAIDALYLHDRGQIDRLAETICEAIGHDRDDIDPEAFFLQWLAADRSEFRLVAAAGVEILGDESLRSDLKERFRDTDRRVQSRAIEAYGRIGERADVDPLEAMLRTDDPMVRRAAGSALAEIGTEPALEALLPVAEADDDRLRRIAVEQLHRLDRPRTAAVLAGAVHDRSKAVRTRAIVSLIELYVTGTSVRPAEVRDHLIEGAEPSKMAELAELLSEILAETGSDAGGERPEIDRQAVWLLGEIADLVNRDDVQCHLVDALKNPDATVADIAAAYLRRLEGEALEAALRATSCDPDVDRETRQQAESILDTIKQNIASDIEDQSVEYTYVRRPTDYTDKHGY
jgi:HEAT repeat protein